MSSGDLKELATYAHCKRSTVALTRMKGVTTLVAIHYKRLDVRFQELLFAFFRGFFRWLGVGVAIIFFFACLAALSSDTPSAKVRALSATGFETRAWKGQDSVAVIRINGAIGSAQLNREKLRQILDACQTGSLKGKVKAILLSIDSPGGGSLESEGMYELLRSYKQLYHVPIYAHADGYCASGAYMLACTADKITSTEYSIIGSVGVIGHLVNYSGAMEKLGLQGIVFQRGEGKDALDPMLPFAPADRAFLEPIVESSYQRFLQIVATARPLMNEKILRQDVGARAYPADEAKRLGFIDEVGTTRAMAVAALAAQAGLASDFAVIELIPTSGWSDMFVEASFQSFENFLIKLRSQAFQVWM